MKRLKRKATNLHPPKELARPEERFCKGAALSQHETYEMVFTFEDLTEKRLKVRCSTPDSDQNLSVHQMEASPAFRREKRHICFF
jgi:hypothetical protein